MVLSAVLGFILGIALGSFVHVNLWVFIAFCILGLICFLYKYFVEEKDRATIVLVSVFIFGSVLGLGRVMISDLYSESKLKDFVGQKIEVEGLVVSEPDVREKNTKLTIKTEKVNGDLVREKILVTVPLYPEFKYGDRVNVNLILEEPKEIEGEDGRVFDYTGYLRVRGIWYTSRFVTPELISSGNGNFIKASLFKTKKAFTSSIDNVLPQPESSLLGGLLLGSKQSLGKELLSEFQRTGISHVVVLSGYNIAIVANSIIDFLKFLPKNVSFGFGALGIILFTILSGSGASAWRASIMVLVSLFAKRSNRDYKASRVLGFTIVLMLAPNPLLLVFDPSFQLSVLATTGLIFVSPLITPYLTKITESFGLREILATTIATQITVLPFLIYNTGVLSLVSLPVNVLILSTIPLTMFLGFLTGIFGFISIYLSSVPAFFTYGLLWYQLKVIHVGSSISFGAAKLPAFSVVFLVLIYVGIFIFIYFSKRKK